MEQEREDYADGRARGLPLRVVVACLLVGAPALGWAFGQFMVWLGQSDTPLARLAR